MAAFYRKWKETKFEGEKKKKKIPTTLVFSQIRASVLCIKADKAFLNLCLFLFVNQIVLTFCFCQRLNLHVDVIVKIIY